MAYIQLQFRRGTAAEWTTANPILALGELGLETDTRQFKIGDGTTAWNSLAYGGIAGAEGPTGPTGPVGATGPQGAVGATGPAWDLSQIAGTSGLLENDGSGNYTWNNTLDGGGATSF